MAMNLSPAPRARLAGSPDPDVPTHGTLSCDPGWW